MGRGWFFCQEKGESRYEETIPDRPATSGARIPAVGPRTKPQPADDLSHVRGRGTSASRSRPPAARVRSFSDEPGDVGRSTAPGGRASPAASRAARPPLGKRRRLLRGGRAEGADPENASAQPGTSRATGWAVTNCSSAVDRWNTRYGTR